MARILVIEDEVVLTKNIQRMLSEAGHSVTVAATVTDGLRQYFALAPELTILDLRLPDGSGLDILAQIISHDRFAHVIMMTAYAAVEDAVRAIKTGAKDYLQKPVSMDDLRHAVKRSLDEQRLLNEVSYFRARDSIGADLDAIFGSCEAIADLRSKIQRLTQVSKAADPPTVLIEGETGTGKGLTARVLHYNGPRARQPFIDVNCSTIPENLVEAELFGYQQGAFTDAKISKPGLFQAADRGTLFLDEIGCLPLAVQAKILKAIEEKTVRQLGSRTEQPVHFQLIAATNTDLEKLVEQGLFREDLFYRVRVATLFVPPLRERGDDVLSLARLFLARLCAKYRIPPMVLSREAEDAICAYPWPGNIRELSNTLDSAVLFSDNQEIDAAALGLPRKAGTMLLLRKDEKVGLEINIPDEGIQFEEVERAMIIGVLRKAKGSQSEAARLLGLTRDTLRYRMEKFGITPSH